MRSHSNAGQDNTTVCNCQVMQAYGSRFLSRLGLMVVKLLRAMAHTDLVALVYDR